MVSRFGSRLALPGIRCRKGSGRVRRGPGLRGVVLGSDEFVERLAGRIEKRALEPDFSKRERRPIASRSTPLFPPTLIADRARRNARIRELTASGRYTAAEIGRHLGLHYSTVSRIAREPAGTPAGRCKIQDLTP